MLFEQENEIVKEDDKKNDIETLKEKMDEELEVIQATYRREGKFIDELLKEYDK